jgi:hypothetical protein
MIITFSYGSGEPKRRKEQYAPMRNRVEWISGSPPACDDDRLQEGYFFALISAS